MPLEPATRMISRAQNGLGAFILPLKKIEFHYCKVGGSSKGMRSYLSQDIVRFARENQAVEISISPRPNRHPVVRGHYPNGREKAICVRNLDVKAIEEKVTLLRNSDGQKLRKSNRAGKNTVKSLNESVRGIWDPFHGDTMYKV